MKICDRKEESAVGGVRVAEDTDDLVMAAQEQAEQGQGQDATEDERDLDERDAENQTAVSHQEAENIIWRFDTRDEDDHRGTNPGSPAKAGLSLCDRQGWLTNVARQEQTS